MLFLQGTVSYEVLDKKKRFQLKMVTKYEKINLFLKMIKSHMVVFTLCCVFLSLSTLYSYTDVLRVGSLNINGGRDRGKLAMVSEFLRIKKINGFFFFTRDAY